IRKLDPPTCTSIRDRQRHGQEYTAQKRVVKTEETIAWAIRSLLHDGCPVSKSSVARLTGLSRPTVIRHFDKVMGWINEECSDSVREEVEFLPKPPEQSLDSIPIVPVEQSVIVSLDSPLTGDRRPASEMFTATGPVTQTDTLRGTERPDGRESLLGGCATGLGVTIDSQVYTPPAAPL